jgi:hypothetical protein
VARQALHPRLRVVAATAGAQNGVDEGYAVNGVKFDGYDDGVLQDAKGEGYARFVRDGDFKPWFDGAQGFVEQAQSQLAAANGTPITWYFAEQEAAIATQNLFDQNGIGINIVYQPPTGRS